MGIVTDPDGNAGAGAQVTACPPGWRWVSANSNGVFRFIWNYQPW